MVDREVPLINAIKTREKVVILDPKGFFVIEVDAKGIRVEYYSNVYKNQRIASGRLQKVFKGTRADALSATIAIHVPSLRPEHYLYLGRELQMAQHAFEQKNRAYRTMHARYDEMMKKILGPQTYVPMDPAPLMTEKAEQTELGRELSELAEKTPQEIVCEMYEHDVVRTARLYMGSTHWGLDYAQSGVSYMLPIYLNRMVNYRITCGGSHRVSNALYKSIFAHQGLIRQSARIERILLDNGRARGVLLEDGREYRAEKAVVSTIDPHQTFLNYVGRENLEPAFLDMIEEFHDYST